MPKELNRDLWLGPVAWRPYYPDWIARTHWRDTSAGQLGNFGPHTANLAFMALRVADFWQPPPPGNTPATIEIEAECSEVNRLSFPLWERIRWRVPARGELSPVTFTWHHGPTPEYSPGDRQQFLAMLQDYGLSQEEIGRRELPGYAGALIVGTKGAILTDSHNVNITLLPPKAFEGVESDRPKSLPASRGHYHDWIHACRGGCPMGQVRVFRHAQRVSHAGRRGHAVSRPAPGVRPGGRQDRQSS